MVLFGIFVVHYYLINLYFFIIKDYGTYWSDYHWYSGWFLSQ